MFYIDHNSDNFTIIDCCLDDDRKKSILDEISDLSAKKGITRFISTHPDEDHIQGLGDLDDKIGILNFYCVENGTTRRMKARVLGDIENCITRAKPFIFIKDVHDIG